MNSVCGVWERLPIVQGFSGEMRALVDTGSTSTLVSREALEELDKEHQIEVCTCSIITLSGPCRVVGEYTWDLEKLAGVKTRVVIHVLEKLTDQYEALIGCDVLDKVGFRMKGGSGNWKITLGKKSYRGKLQTERGEHRVEVTRREVELPVRGFDDIFYKEGDLLPATGKTMHEIALKENKVSYTKGRRYPQAMVAIIEEQIRDLLNQGIIRHSTSPFNSPLWIVEKKRQDPQADPSYRLVIDYRKLNENTVEERYPLPRLEDILDRLAGARVFSTLDLKSGYHQVRMKEDDIAKTAFTFSRGHYEFTRMPFGLKNAPLTFQRLMDEFLRGLGEDYCQIYMDDLIVFSSSTASHRDHLKLVFERVREFGLRLSREKSSFFQTEIKFLGHRISEHGVKPDPSRIDAITRVQPPRNQKELKSFLGMVNYYRKFLPNAAEIIAPLTQLLKKGRPFLLTDEHLSSFQKCKTALTQEPVLAFPDFQKTFIVTTDASEKALGAVLSQESSSGDRPVAFASRQLSDAESRYSALERELLAVVWAIDHFRPYLFGRRFTIRTDHKPLLWTSGLKESSARVGRWKEKLRSYTFDITHRKGSLNVVADWLSRALYANPLQEAGPSTVPTVEDTSMGEEDTIDADEVPVNVRPSALTETDTIVNHHSRQIIWKTRTMGISKEEHTKYGRHSIITVWSVPSISAEDITRILLGITRRGKTYYLYIGNKTVLDRVKHLWNTEQIGTLFCVLT